MNDDRSTNNFYVSHSEMRILSVLSNLCNKLRYHYDWKTKTNTTEIETMSFILLARK